MGKWKKVAGSSGQGNVMGLDYDFSDDFDFTYFDRSDDYKLPKDKASRASSVMKPESHPWLQFMDADRNEKVICLNMLAVIQDFLVAKPKRVDWHFLGRLGVQDDILTMIRSMGMNQQMDYENIDMCGVSSALEEPAYREWCLEFYSTLDVEPILMAEEITLKQTIHFRLGGRNRHCTVLGFAYLTGMLEKEEMRQKWVHNFMLKGVFNVPEFPDDKTSDQYWYEISGQGAHDSYSSKLSQIWSKRLRILHKMITNSFLQCGDNNNKFYSEDLWLLRYFMSCSLGEHVLAPYILARHMSRHKEKRLLCGHFVFEIAKRLGLEHRPENNRNLGNPVRVGLIGELDFVKSGMLSTDRNRLLEDDEAHAPRTRRRKAETTEPEGEEEEDVPPQMGLNPYDFTDLRGDIQRLAHHQAFMIEQQKYFSTQQSRMDYTLGYYRPMWHSQMEQMYQSRPNVEDRQMPEFSPPELYIPRQFQSDYPYPPHTYSGASGSQPHVSSSFNTGGTSGSGVGASVSGAAYNPLAHDPYDAELFGVQYGKDGDGTQSVWPHPDDMQD